MCVPLDKLDSHADILNTPSGVIELSTGNRYSNDPYWWATKSTGVHCDNTKKPCPRWAQFLIDTFGEDWELIGYVQQLAGLTAIGEVIEHVFPYLYGPSGDNGKSVLMDVLSAVLGDYAITAPANFLLAGRDKHETEIARLKGARFVAGSEVNAGATFDEARLKLLTSGDRITGRYMRGDFFDFTPTHTLWLMGNHLPRVPAGGNSFWRRMRVIPFTRQVPPDRRVEGLARQLVAEEGPQILAWIVAGAVEVINHGLMDTPAAVLAATGAYAEAETVEDPFAAFAAECLESSNDPNDFVVPRAMFAAYQRWAEAYPDRAEWPLLPKQVSRHLKRSAGLSARPVNGLWAYHRVRILPNWAGWRLDAEGQLVATD
jgi:putative DNA primase/helicase